jgi:hypothetical protein
MDSQFKLSSVAFLWLPSYGCLVLPTVALRYLWLPLVALCYLLLHISKDHALYIYHDLVSLAGHIIHPSIHSFHEPFLHSYTSRLTLSHNNKR